MSQLSEPGCKACEEGASGVCTRHNEHGRASLQSTPSSPPPAIKLATYLLAKLPSHWQYDEVRTMAKEVVTAAPSDAGQPRCGGTLGLDGDTERDWATDGPAWEKRGMAAEVALEKLRELLMRIRADLIQYVNDKECPVCGEDLQGTHEPFCSIGELIMEATPQQPAEQD